MDLTWLKIRINWFFEIRVPHLFERITCAVWNRGIKLRWYRLWIRKDEFHPSLSYDPMATRHMSQEQRLAYVKDLNHRRDIARERDLKRYFAEAK